MLLFLFLYSRIPFLATCKSCWSRRWHALRRVKVIEPFLYQIVADLRNGEVGRGGVPSCGGERSGRR